MFNVHLTNLEAVKAILTQHDVDAVYLHGDGNIYDTQEQSDFRKEFSNPSNTNAQYRVKFTRVAQVPDDLEVLEKMFYEQRQKEEKAEKAAQTTGASKVKTITLEKPSAKPAGAGKTQAELDEEELQRQIAEEEKKKAAAGGAQ